MSTDLTDSQWEFIKLHIPPLPVRVDGKGRPWRESRDVLNGILWILRTGAHWQEMPDRYPPYQTCHRRFQRWVKQGVMDCILESLAEDLERRGKINLNECFIDGSFSAAKKGGRGVGATKRGKGTKIMAIADRNGLPVALWATSARPHETKLVEELLIQRSLSTLPQKLVGDRAYDSDPLDKLCLRQGVELIAPHRKGRVKPATQDGRPLRRYKRRWKVERLFAWLHNFRRIVTRYEKKLGNYEGFLRLAGFMILAKKYL